MKQQHPRGGSLRGLFPGVIQTKKQKILALILAVLLFLLAAGITAYPIISSRYNQKHQSQIHVQHRQKLEQMERTDLNRMRQAARAYNATILPGAKTGEVFSREAIIQAAKEYRSLLNPAGDGVMGYVEIPRLRVTLPIYHGTEDKTLELGIGHLLGSSLPVGGSSTHTILTAHSGMASQKMFSDLPQLKAGDVFYLDILGERLAYQVDQIKTVLPYDTTYLGVEEGKDLCTLVTCTPFGVNTHRLLVRGSRIPYDKAEVIQAQQPEIETPASNWEQEYFKSLAWSVGGAAALLLCGGTVYGIRKVRKHDEA